MAALSLLCLTALTLLAAPGAAEPVVLSVSPGTDDTAGLAAARDDVRRLLAAGPPAGGIVVELAGGVYELQAPLVLEQQDSGTAEAPVVWRAAPGARVRLVGGRVLSAWQPVTDPAVLQRIDPAAHGHVMQCDLRAAGVGDLGEVKAGERWAQSDPGLELFFDDQPMTPARWPNEGFAKIPELHGPTEVDVRGTKGCREPIFGYEGDRPSRWVGEPDVMLHGYWFWDWADQRLRVESIDAEQRIITLESEPQHAFGFRKGQWWYAYNLLPELDQPGEWYLNRASGILYFWPPAPLDGATAMVSVTPTLLSLQDVSHLDVRGLSLEAVRETAVVARNVDHVRLVGCTIRNVGSWAVSLTGADSGVLGCDIANCGDGGVNLNGGDRKTLTPARLFVENCHIHHFSRWDPVYKPAVAVNGVGQRVAHNLMHDSPHMAISFSGNDHLIELNEIHSVVYQSNDAGVMYAGRDCTMRGHVIRHNYIHHIYGYEGRGCVGIYLDDMFCSADMVGNVFFQVPRATFIGGGRDNRIANNIYIDCSPAVHIDARALGWAAGTMPQLLKQVESLPTRDEPWRSRFPQLLTYAEDEPAVPKYNVVERNICVGGKFDGIQGQARPHVTVGENLLDVDPRFVDAAAGNFQLRDDSPAYAMGFERIPFDDIGLYESADRASWPVAHQVRPAPAGHEPPVARPKREPVVFDVPATDAPLTVDGELTAAEWLGLDPARGLTLAQDVAGQPVEPRSLAWLAHDGEALRVAFDNAVRTDQPIATTHVWGRDDAVEIAIRPGGKPNDPILIVRGYPDGHVESSSESGAPAERVTQAGRGVAYAARVVAPDRWTAEFRLPWASLGIDPANAGPLALNLSVRKAAGNLWVEWLGTGGSTWEVENAGRITLAR